ncbi:MAG: RNA methyltransferase [Clostridia bacterium]|nr:RNA methyltransferase [Clostridia bacterium]
MITSKQNALIKEIRSLADKKFRDRLNLFVVEGIKPVNEAVGLSMPVKVIICTEKAVQSLCVAGVDVQVVTDEVFKSVSEEVSPQGALAVVEKPQTPVQAPKGSCLLLDGVSDPANVGAIIRTAAASGYNDVYLTETCADAYSQKAVRTSMSGIFHVRVMRGKIQDLLACIDLPICVADMNGENVFEYSAKTDVCLVIGNEGHGVSEEIKKIANFTVKIPMENGMESLNAGVSAGILMYNLKNRKQK